MTDEKPKIPVTTIQQEARQQFGVMLAQAREKAGYSVEELAHATKILTQFLQALEVGEFEKLPGEVFIRGFIKSISRVIGSDAVELLKLVDIALDHKRAEKLLVVQGSPGASTVRVGKEWRDSRFNIRGGIQFVRALDRRIYFGAAVLGLGLLLGYGAVLQIQKWAKESDLSSNKRRTAKPVAEVVSIQNPAPQAAEGTTPSVAGAGTSAEGAKVDDKTAGSTAAVPAAPTEQVVELNVKEGVNIRINVDGRGWETSRYEPDSYKISFKEQINLLVFDAAAVDVSFNGKSLGSLGSKGKVRRLSFMAEGLSTPPSL